jgi:DNA processing protein
VIIGACDACLRRALLIERLAPHIERVATGGGGRGSPELLALEDDCLASAVGGRRADEILTEARAASARDLRRRVDAARCWTTCRHDAAYPAALLDLGAEAPAALFGRGEQEALAGLDPPVAATIVGARRASVYGLGVAEELGRMLARAGIAVISGLANGVDSRAHRGALDGDGMTIAVLGGGATYRTPAVRWGSTGALSRPEASWCRSSRRARHRFGGASRRATGSWRGSEESRSWSRPPSDRAR